MKKAGEAMNSGLAAIWQCVWRSGRVWVQNPHMKSDGAQNVSVKPKDEGQVQRNVPQTLSNTHPENVASDLKWIRAQRTTDGASGGSVGSAFNVSEQSKYVFSGSKNQ
ncbi:hypothetical protein GOODEAATRI_002843 [Goodea atripinnis]|uniref:Uncharacterized protein n=1 Tax=Goodea atripinnis TaxID=208336 RepID=A0ABV0MNU3_9TELE